MKATEAQIEERLPVWEALSEFFLDTRLDSSDYERIARTLAASNYSATELEAILICEVCPICRWNLLSPAGEWVAFDKEWLKEKIRPRYGTRFRFRRLATFLLAHRLWYTNKWKETKRRFFKH